LTGALQLIGEPPDHQIATEAQGWSGVMQYPPGTPQLLCRPIEQPGDFAIKLGQVRATQSSALIGTLAEIEFAADSSLEGGGFEPSVPREGELHRRPFSSNLNPDGPQVSQQTFGSSVTFISNVTIIPFMPDGWDAAAGGFPAMTGNVPFLMKDVVLFAASVHFAEAGCA